MRRPLIFALLALAATPAFAKKREAPPLLDPKSYPAREDHPQEHVTIAVDPFDSRDRCNFFRVDYYGHSFLPVRFILRNDSDTTLNLDDVRIQFIPAEGERIPAALPDEINRRLFRLADTKPRHIPGLPQEITYHKAPVDKKIVDDDNDFSIHTTSVAPHATLSGFLFYDIRDVDDHDGRASQLKGAEIYVKQIKSADGKQLFPFSIALDKYLAQKPKPDTNKDKEHK